MESSALKIKLKLSFLELSSKKNLVLSSARAELLGADNQLSAFPQHLNLIASSENFGFVKISFWVVKNLNFRGFNI